MADGRVPLRDGDTRPGAAEDAQARPRIVSTCSATLAADSP